MIAPAQHAATHDPDTALMLRISNDDVEAFNLLYGKHRDRLVRVITHLTGDKSTSEDLAQQVFLQIYRARGDYTPSAKFTTWLFAITRNVVFNARRSQRRRRELPLASQAMLPGDTFEYRGRFEDSNPLDAAVRAEVQQFVGEAISQLGALQQQAIRLVYFHGCSYQAAAEQMGVTVDSVRRLLHRGKGVLRQSLQSGIRQSAPTCPASIMP